MYVWISIDSSENRDFFPYKKKYWIGFIKRKSIVKSIPPQQSTPIDLHEQVD